jgi:hypothetical protein
METIAELEHVFSILLDLGTRFTGARAPVPGDRASSC